MAERRINPFALPAETDARFHLLIIAAVLFTAWAGVMVTAFFGGLYSVDIPILQADFPSLDSLPTDLPVEERLVEHRARLLLYVSQELGRLSIPVALLFGLFLVAALRYRLHPYLVRRQFPSKRLDPEAHPELSREVARLIERAELEESPIIEIGSSLQEVDGQAYGFPPKFIFRVGGAARRLKNKRKDVVEAVILHEVAHIANGDVGRYYFSQAIWLSTIVVLFAPAMLGLSGGIVKGIGQGGRWGISFLLMLQFGAQIALIRAIFAGLLRIREKYADWRASEWRAHRQLKGILEDRLSSDKASPLKMIWRRHPTHRDRLKAITNPASLFRLSWDLPLTVGALSGLLLGGLFVLTVQAASLTSALVEVGSISAALLDFLGAFGFGAQLVDVGIWLIYVVLGIPFMLVAATLAATVALEVHRETLAKLVRTGGSALDYIDLARPALLLTVGLEIGYLITPPPLFSPLLNLLRSSRLDLSAYLLLTLGTFLLAWLTLAVIRFAGSRVFGTHTGPSPPTLKRRLLTVAFAVVYWGFLLQIHIQRATILNLGPSAPAIFADLARWGLFGSLGALLVVSTAAWIYSRWEQRGGKATCPHCEATIEKGNLLALRCSHCSSYLAAWLFV